MARWTAAVGRPRYCRQGVRGLFCISGVVLTQMIKVTDANASSEFVDKLKAAGKPAEYMPFKGESKENRK